MEVRHCEYYYINYAKLQLSLTSLHRCTPGIISQRTKNGGIRVASLQSEQNWQGDSHTFLEVKLLVLPSQNLSVSIH